MKKDTLRPAMKEAEIYALYDLIMDKTVIKRVGADLRNAIKEEDIEEYPFCYFYPLSDRNNFVRTFRIGADDNQGISELEVGICGQIDEDGKVSTHPAISVNGLTYKYKEKARRGSVQIDHSKVSSLKGRPIVDIIYIDLKSVPGDDDLAEKARRKFGRIMGNATRANMLDIRVENKFSTTDPEKNDEHTIIYDAIIVLSNQKDFSTVCRDFKIVEAL